MTRDESLLEAALELGYAPRVRALIRGWLARPGDPALKPYPSAPCGTLLELLAAHGIQTEELVVIGEEYYQQAQRPVYSAPVDLNALLERARSMSLVSARPRS